MSHLESNSSIHFQETNPWLLWIIFLSAILMFISLWTVSLPVWHLFVSVMTIAVLWYSASSPLKTLLLIVSLVLFLAVLQITFSPYMRNLFLTSIKEGFRWADWQYLLFAVERLAWPLMIVSIFDSKLRNPTVASHLTSLLFPLKWIGLKIYKLQILILLALRFLPSLRQEWDRFSHFQTYFTARTTQKSLIQKLNYAQGILRAMISHTIHRSASTGDMLALRGLPSSQTKLNDQKFLGPLLIWFPMGLLFNYLDVRLVILWLIMSVWMGLTAIAVSQKSSR